MKHIKKFSVLFALLFAMVMVIPACSDDDDKDGNKLVGTWVLMDSEYSESITFNANGTGVWYYDYDSDRFTWTATENTVTLVYEYGSEPATFQYSISSDGKQLYFDGDVYFRR